MNTAGFEPSITASERAQTHVLYSAATGINPCDSHFDLIFFKNIFKRLVFMVTYRVLCDVVTDILWEICINTSNPRINKITSFKVSLFLEN